MPTSTMLAFRDSGGTIFTARSALGVVRRMRQQAWMVPGKQVYMREVAHRIHELDPVHSRIDTTSPDAFIESLVAYGWLFPVPVM